MQDRTVKLQHVKIVPMDFSKMRRDEWLIKTPFEIKKLSRPPKKIKKRAERKQPRRRERPRPRQSPVQNREVYSPAAYENILRREARQIQRTKIRHRLLLDRRARRKALKEHRRQQEERQRLYKLEVQRIRRLESIEKPEPTLASDRPNRDRKYKYDMLDHGSSAENTSLSQSEPEVCGDVFLHDHIVTDEPVPTDNEEKFHPDIDDSDEEMTTYPQNAQQPADQLHVEERIQKIPKYQKMLQKVLKL